MPDAYDGDDDFSKSIEVAYEAIRKREAAGGKRWEPKSVLDQSRPYAYTARVETLTNSKRKLENGTETI